MVLLQQDPAVLGFCILFFWLLVLLVQRLYLSPLAQFPGPKLAALTTLYEFYFDGFLEGCFGFEIKRLHDIYGPVIRISPFEIHINDTFFFNEAFAARAQLDKYPAFYNVASAPGGSIGTYDHNLHRTRRGPLQRFLTRHAVAESEELIQRNISKLCRVVTEIAHKNQPITLSRLCRAFATDVVSEYTLQKPFDLLSAPDQGELFQQGIRRLFEIGAVTRHCEWFIYALKALPLSWLGSLDSGSQTLLATQIHIRDQINAVISGEETMGKPEERRASLIEHLLESKLSPEDKSSERLLQEVQSVIVAGSETTGNAMTVMLFHILNNPTITRRLQDEIDDSIVAEGGGDEEAPPKLNNVEALPYLNAVLTEGLRMSYGVSSRLPRVNTRNDVVYGTWCIPAGTAVSMTPKFCHDDPNIFPNPRTFDPERWLSSTTEGDVELLKEYMHPFGAGSRICVGSRLAMAEMSLLLFTLFRKFDLQLFDTVLDDIETAHDLGAPFPRKGSRGLRVQAQPRAAQTRRDSGVAWS